MALLAERVLIEEPSVATTPLREGRKDPSLQNEQPPEIDRTDGPLELVEPGGGPPLIAKRKRQGGKMMKGCLLTTRPGEESESNAHHHHHRH